jgi:hypothetical protein
MANRIADARRSLIRAREAAEQRLVEIENERREIRASMKSLDAALKALGRSNELQDSAKRAPAKPNDGSSDATTSSTQRPLPGQHGSDPRMRN